MIKGKHYSKDELIKEGYNLDVDLSSPSPCSNQKIRTLLIENKKNKSKLHEVDMLENVAVRLNGSDYFVKGKYLCHKKKDKGTKAFLYTLKFHDGEKEPIYLSDIKELLVKNVEGDLVEKVLREF